MLPRVLPFALLLGVSSVLTSQVPTVNGFVYDRISKQPIENAYVTVDELAGVGKPTDDRGGFSISLNGLAPSGSRITVRIRAANYVSASRLVSRSGDVFTIELTRVKTPGNPPISRGFLLVDAGDSSSALGGMGGSPFSLSCGREEVLIGVVGRSMDFRLSQLQGVCVKVAFRRAGRRIQAVVSDTARTTSVGSSQGRVLVASCPRSSYMIGAKLHANGFGRDTVTNQYISYTSGIAIRCGTLLVPRPASSALAIDTLLPVVGGTISDSQPETDFRCKGGGFVNRLFGRSGVVIDQLAVSCVVLQKRQ